MWWYYISSSVRSAHEALELHLTLVYYEFTSACPARSESRRMCGRLKWRSKFTFFLVTCTFMIDQVWSILPALEFLLLDCSHCRQKVVFCLRRDQLRGRNSNAGKMDPTWCRQKSLLAAARGGAIPMQTKWIKLDLHLWHDFTDYYLKAAVKELERAPGLI